jgi:hypothetical protein
MLDQQRERDVSEAKVSSTLASRNGHPSQLELALLGVAELGHRESGASERGGVCSLRAVW